MQNNNQYYKINRVESEKINKSKPSVKMRHIKKIDKVNEALKDLEINHNHSWYHEIIKRISDDLNRETIYYRGNTIDGNTMQSKSIDFAKSFQKMGLKKGDEVIACMSNVPELIYLMLSANMLGIKINFIGEGFDKNFIRSIVSSNEKKLFIATDDKYGKIKDIINEFNFQNKVLISLTDSLRNGVNPYIDLDRDFYEFKNNVLNFKKEDGTILSNAEFIKLGKEQELKIPENITLDDEFTITYTSGSTKLGWPKAIIHTNRHYISIGRFHDSDLSRMPAMRDMRGLSHIPTHSNTNLASSISDPLMQKCSVACEPIYDQNFFARSLLINKPGFAPATRSFWITAMKQFENSKEFENATLPFAINYVIVGEGSCKNEEIYINRILKKLKAGSKKIPKPLSPITISLGGGDCEHGGLFFTLFKGLREKISFNKNIRNDYGMIPFQLSQIAVLREDGTECDYNEVGCLVANSPCTMKEYKDNAEANGKFIVTDSEGRKWGTCNVWAYIDKKGNVHMKGRKESQFKLSDNDTIPNFQIASTILKNTRNIMSCEVVNKEYGEDIIPIAHIELYPNSKTSIKKIVKEIEDNCKLNLPEEISSRIMYRFRDGINSFPLTKSGKRSNLILEQESIDDAIKPLEIDGEIKLLTIEKYRENLSKNKSGKVLIKKR